jgi:hypothetical protein
MPSARNRLSIWSVPNTSRMLKTMCRLLCTLRRRFGRRSGRERAHSGTNHRPRTRGLWFCINTQTNLVPFVRPQSLHDSPMLASTANKSTWSIYPYKGASRSLIITKQGCLGFVQGAMECDELTILRGARFRCYCARLRQRDQCIVK